MAEKTFGVRQAGGLLFVGAGLLSAIAGVGLMLAPARYEAVSRIRLERGSSYQAGAGNAKKENNSDPVQTAVATIQSPPILGRVIDTLGLCQRWGQRDSDRDLSSAEALTLLQLHTSVRPVPNTTVIEIHVSSKDPAETAEIANAIA